VSAPVDVPRVKICGLTRPEHAAAAAAAGVEFIGLMFAERSRRRLTIEQARAVLDGLPPRRVGPVRVLTTDDLAAGWFRACATAADGLIAAAGRPLVVGVFADQPVALMNAIADTLQLDLIQLGGHEPFETALQLARPAIATLRASAGADPSALLAAAEPGTANLCMLDADVPGRLGGTGERADWEVAAALARSLPLILAGGLTPENVAGAIARVRPWAVDVSSGVERDGVKDVNLIEQFVRAARAVAPVG
jgi:phosphoribosylanthranilate isomerase